MFWREESAAVPCRPGGRRGCRWPTSAGRGPLSCPSSAISAAPPAGVGRCLSLPMASGQQRYLALVKVPSSRRYKYSMCITSVFLMLAFSRNSSRMRGRNPGLSRPARRNCRYSARTCFCSLLCRAIRDANERRSELNAPFPISNWPPGAAVRETS
uniref:Uncharacterized protein n=1 Tax=Hippocampus comes TaxID=109280 RepID=A0A3Q2X8P5_HIPCM